MMANDDARWPYANMRGRARGHRDDEGKTVGGGHARRISATCTYAYKCSTHTEERKKCDVHIRV